MKLTIRSLFLSLWVIMMAIPSFAVNEDANEGVIISRISNFIVKKAIAPIEYLEKAGLSVSLCQFYDPNETLLIESQSLEECLVRKFNHDLQFEDNGRLDVLFKSKSQRSWAHVDWDHVKLRKLDPGKTGWRRYVQKFKDINFSRLYSQSFNHHIVIEFETPLVASLPEVFKPISVKKIEAQVKLRSDALETFGYVEFFGENFSPLVLVRSTLTGSKIVSDKTTEFIPDWVKSLVRDWERDQESLKVDPVSNVVLTCFSSSDQSRCRDENEDFLKEFKNEN